MHYAWTTKNSLQLRKIVGAVVLFTTLAATPAYGATRPAPRPTAKAIVAQMFKNLPNIKTSHATSVIHLNSVLKNPKGKVATNVNGEINLETYSDATDAANPASFAVVSVNGSESMGTSPAQPYDFGTMQFTKIGRDTTYISYTASPIVQTILSGFAGQDLAPIISKYTSGQWVTIDKSSFANISDMLFGYTSKDFNTQRIEQVQNIPTLTPGQTQKILKTLSQTTALSVVYKNLENVDGVPAYHLQIVVRKQGLVPLVNTLQKIVGLPALTKAEQIKMNSQLAATTLPAIDLWVGTTDFMPHRVVMSLYTTLKDYRGTTKTTASIDTRLDQFDGLSMAISAPNNSVKVETIVKEISDYEASFSDTSTVRGRDSKRISDLRQVQTALELFYVDHNTYPAGTAIMLGSTDAACLSDKGWEKIGCVYPYMAGVPGDAFGGTFMYTSSASNTYAVDAQLEGTVQDLSGAIKLTPNGIFAASK